MESFLAAMPAVVAAASPAPSVAAATASPAAASALPTVHASFTVHLRAAPERAFPLFDPVNETRWSPEWHPALLGDARVAAGLVFTTQDEHGRAAWLLDRYDAGAHVIRYVVARLTTLTTIDIAVVPDGPGASAATVSYRRTALDESARDAVTAFAAHFPAQGPHWEAAINAALAAPNGP